MQCSSMGFRYDCVSNEMSFHIVHKQDSKEKDYASLQTCRSFHANRISHDSMFSTSSWSCAILTFLSDSRKNNLCAIQISLLCKQLHFRSTSLIYILSQTLCRSDNESSVEPHNNLRSLNKNHKTDVLLHSSDNGTTSGEGFESSNVEDEVDDKSPVLSEVHSEDDMKVPVWHDPEAIARERINYNGEIFRIILDITLGIVAGFYLFSHSSSTDIPVTYLRLVMSTLQQSMDSNIEWLMGVPVGMKLNQPLTRQLGRLVLSVLRVWARVMEILVKSYVVLRCLFCNDAYTLTTQIRFQFDRPHLVDRNVRSRFHRNAFTAHRSDLFVHGTHIYNVSIFLSRSKFSASHAIFALETLSR